jgi:hypothetical protein
MGPDGYNAIGELISAPFAFIGSTLAMAHVAKSTFFRTVVANCMAGVVALMVAAGVVVTTVLIIMANEPGGVANAIGNFP